MAIVRRAPGDIRLGDVSDSTIRHPHDAIVPITTSAIWGTDLHFARGTISGMREGTIPGHEAVGTIQDVGPEVRSSRPGDDGVGRRRWAAGFARTVGRGTTPHVMSPAPAARPRGRPSPAARRRPSSSSTATASVNTVNAGCGPEGRSSPHSCRRTCSTARPRRRRCS